MEYNVGDRVKIKSIDWHNKNCGEFGEVKCKHHNFVKSMIQYCGSILTIIDKKEDGYWVNENSFKWTDEMIECLVERNGKTYPYKIGDRVVLKGNNRCATITDLKYNSWGNLSYYIKIDNDKDISIDYPTDLLLPYDNMNETIAENDDKPKFKVGDIIISDVFSTNDDDKWIVTDVERTGYILKSVNNSDIICDMDLKNEQYYKLVEEKSQSKFNIGDIVYCKTWQIDVIIQDIIPGGFYKVGDIRGLGWFTTAEDSLCETDVCKKCGLVRNSTRCLFMYNCPYNKQKNVIKIPENWIIKDDNGNIINTTQIIVEKKQNTYPKTYEECCKVLDFCGEYFFTTYDEGIHLPENDNIAKIHQILKSTSILTKLIICRNAYWKIYGEENGLGKPWEPDWEDENKEKYIIGVWLGTIQGLEENFVSHPLTFPTPEIRDDFYENFKEEIEFCKELL